MLVDSRCPPTTALARRHNPPTPSPKRRRAADHAALAAATATASGRPPIRGARSPTATQNRLNPTANSSARQANRRRQSRTVVCAKPNPPADRRIPTPPHIVSSAEPITSTASRRPQVKNPGNKACVPSQHRARRTDSRWITSALTRTSRSYHPQNDIGRRHRGQSGRGTSTSRPAATYRSTSRSVGHTIAIGTQPFRAPSDERPTQVIGRGPVASPQGSCRSSPAALAAVSLPSPRAESVLNYPSRIKPLHHHQDLPVTPPEHQTTRACNERPCCPHGVVGPFSTNGCALGALSHLKTALLEARFLYSSLIG